MVSFFFTILQLLYTRKFIWSTDKFVKSQCLNNSSMACFGGKHRRNVFTMKEIGGYVNSLLVFQLIYNVMIVYFQFFCERKTSHICFILHNIFYFCFVDLYISVVIPIKHLILCHKSLSYSTQQKETNTKTNFYVRNYLEEFQMIMKKTKQNKTQSGLVTKINHVNSMPNVEI